MIVFELSRFMTKILTYLMKVKYVVRKTFDIRYSGRSSDYISPSFAYGCQAQCRYCYVDRHMYETITIAKNYGDILTAINNHVMWLPEKEPNQTHQNLYTYDIGCNEDFPLHLKYHKWIEIFDFFKQHPRIMATLATKYAVPKLLTYKPDRKIRIRLSLMPQVFSDILEPYTTNIKERIEFINKLHDVGYDVHINFSPVVRNSSWHALYSELFNDVNDLIRDDVKPHVKAEVIFLTHNEGLHKRNMQDNYTSAEKLLWTPSVQEAKTSQYGGKNVRYNAYLKKQYIEEFVELHDSIIDWNTIRYIF